MTPDQKTLVQTTFAQVATISETAAALFYAKLFELDPSLRPLFRGDLRDQGRKLMEMIGLAVRHLDDFERLAPAIQNLGSRHAGYGVKDEHYETVATALLWTLKAGLGESFTPEARAAWIAVYTLLANTMKDGAAEPLARTA
ncbi:MAG: globin family protein [Chloroflexota bacterium]